MLRPNTITVASASVAVLPRFVHPIAGVAPVAEEPSQRKIGPRQIPHKFMRPIPPAP